MKYAVMQWNWIKLTDIWTIDVKRLGFIEMCYVFSYLCVPLIGSDHVVNKSHVCKESVFLGMVWYGRKRIEGFSPLHFIQCPNI